MSVRRIAFNLLTFIPGMSALPPVERILNRRSIGTGGTNSARYCYSVWLRHLAILRRTVGDVPLTTIAELGPGDSIGIGLAAMLSGAERYLALDVVPHANVERNLQVFDELIDLFRQRSPIPDDAEFPQVRPNLTDWSFPPQGLNGLAWESCLDQSRVERIRDWITQPGSSASPITYKAPWMSSDVLEPAAADLILSQAVLEHVDLLAETYSSMRMWLKPEGVMSHVIDFRSHGWARTWDGHWNISDLAWKIVRGKDIWAINREPLSLHEQLLSKNGFAVLARDVEPLDPTYARRRLASRFKNMTEIDRRACGAHLIVGSI